MNDRRTSLRLGAAFAVLIAILLAVAELGLRRMALLKYHAAWNNFVEFQKTETEERLRLSECGPHAAGCNFVLNHRLNHRMRARAGRKIRSVHASQLRHHEQW